MNTYVVMWDLFIYLFLFHNIGFAECAYPPIGDEVQAGSVLLPASRRGRYLANIARRQAVDGTGIKFNKDADRMNAEAKKKVDVLSEELLPYIIAEQERRVTLYKRVMTAIQNGEKGVTIAEIRNKPPAIIRKGLMYRCPTNRAPREPDGSGVILCEDDLNPTPIMFESCLSAEDKELYVAENKYFFCNRHKAEGADLPLNGTMVIGCSPCERTSLNFTSRKCALEDTDDVVVHYRYYPDRTYKFVSELDPLREVCDHWNPCQVGYIFSLPSPDQATPASELWQDSIEEMVPLEFVGQNYTTSRLVSIPDGYQFLTIGRRRSKDTYGWNPLVPWLFQDMPPWGYNPSNMIIDYKILDKYVKITLKFRPLLENDFQLYFVRSYNRVYTNFLHIRPGQTKLTPTVLYAKPTQQLNVTNVSYTCEQCALEGITLRADDGSVRDLELDKYHLRNTEKVIEFKFGTVKASDFGDYFLIIRNANGSEERVKAISIKVDPSLLISLKPIQTATTVGKPVDMKTTYQCVNDNCELVDVLCHGESALASGGVEHIATSKSIRFNFASFKDQNACVYLAKFKIGDDIYSKNVAIVEKVKLVPIRETPPAKGKFFHRGITYNCTSPDCRLVNVTVNGFPLNDTTRRPDLGSVSFYWVKQNTTKISIGVLEFLLYEAVYQGVFVVGAEQITKTLMEIGPDAVKGMHDSGRRHENQKDVLETDSQAAAIEDVEPEELLSGGESGGQPEREHLSPPGTRRSTTDADKSTP